MDHNYTNTLVVSLRKLKYSNDHISLLSTGHNYCPIPHGPDPTRDDKTILVTTYHSHDMTVPKIVSSNWDILGKSHNTSFLHEK